jgi:hypothetical protein
LASTQRDYWSFYWPLSLLSLVALAGRFVQNYVLLDYEAGVKELAVFALALSVFHPFQAATLGFVPHMANVLVRGPKSFRASLRFVITAGLAFTVPPLLLAWTPLGLLVLPRVFSVGPDRIARIIQYLRYFSPLVLMGGLSSLFFGLLVQARRTGIVTMLRLLNLSLSVAVLAVGIRLAWGPVVTLSLSLVLPAAAHMVVSGILMLRFRRQHEPGRDEPLRQRTIAAFFLPMVLTSLLFTVSRPIIFAFLTVERSTGDPGLPAVESMIAALSLAFTFSMLFQSAVNQFRHLFVTFGHRDRSGVRRFMIRVAAAMAALMVVAALTPLAGLFFRYLQGASGETLRMAKQAIWPLCVVPIVIGCRNYCHGVAMVRKRTGSMAAGALARNIAIVAVGSLLVAAGRYSHVTAAVTLIAGFSAEALAVFVLTRGLRAEAAAP